MVGEDGWSGTCELALRDLSRVGETNASLVDEEDAGIAGRDLGDGKACDDRCKAGEDMEANLRDGVV